MKMVECEWSGIVWDNAHKEIHIAHKEHGKNLALCDSWKCQCGNTPDGAGFHPTNRAGTRSVEPDQGVRYFYRCDTCHTVYQRNGLEVQDDVGDDDNALVLQIQDVLDGLEWDSDTTEEISTLLQNAGYTVRDPND